MDDIALNPDFYDLFREPALLMLAAGWLLAIFVFRRFSANLADLTFFAGAAIVVLAAAVPVMQYVKAEVPLLWRQSVFIARAGTADPLRERDPFFNLLQTYLKSNPSYPLAVIDPGTGDGVRWAAYYLYPRPIVKTTSERLAAITMGPSDPPRWVLATALPRLSADVGVSIEERVGEWMLIRLQGRSTP